MSYRKATKVPRQGNTERCLVLRQQYALVILPLLEQSRRIINVDESALTYLDFRRRIWAPKGSSHGIKVPPVAPRLSLIMAIDNHQGRSP